MTVTSRGFLKRRWRSSRTTTGQGTSANCKTWWRVWSFSRRDGSFCRMTSPRTSGGPRERPPSFPSPRGRWRIPTPLGSGLNWNLSSGRLSTSEWTWTTSERSSRPTGHRVRTLAFPGVWFPATTEKSRSVFALPAACWASPGTLRSPSRSQQRTGLGWCSRRGRSCIVRG